MFETRTFQTVSQCKYIIFYFQAVQKIVIFIYHCNMQHQKKAAIKIKDFFMSVL